MKSITLKEVAAEAGVHVATASAILNWAGGSTRVAEETRRRVTEIAQRLAYVPNESARRLRKGISSAVGFIGGDLRNPFFAELAAAVEAEVSAQGRQLIISHVAPGHGATFRRMVDSLHRQTVQNIIYWDESPQKTPGYAPPGITLLPLGFTLKTRPGVWLDLEYAISQSIHHFAARGRRRLGFYAPTLEEESPSVRVRWEMFSRQCLALGLPQPASTIYLGESWDIESAVQGAREVLRKHHQIEAFLGFNDTAALGLLLAGATAAQKPEVICFDGTRLVRQWPGSPPYFDLKIPQLAARVSALLAEKANARLLGHRKNWLRPELIVAAD